MTRAAAFFDVDNTLIAVQSMLSFLQFFYRITGREAEYQRILTQLQSLRDSGASREVLNLAFYAVLKGERWVDLQLIGQRWFDDTCVVDHLISETRMCLEQHREEGSMIVLVSGSFAPCLDPLAAILKPDAVLCTELSVHMGYLTGEVAYQMIGQGKVQAIRRWVSELPIDLQASHAYGDDVSDSPMLELVGFPVVVGSDPELFQMAEHLGWRRIQISGG